MTNIAYFNYPGVDGSYFACERYGTMSTRSCAQNYRAAPEASREGRLAGCVGCKVGASHNGGELAKSGQGSSAWCVRCRRAPSEYRGSGMGRVRLVRAGVCVSCANREYEAIRGVNAKGGVPKSMAELAPRFTGLIAGGQITVVRERMARDRLEVGIGALRRSTNALAFCWVSVGVLPPAPPANEQLVLFDGGGGRARAPLRHAPARQGADAWAQPLLFEEIA